MYNSRSLAAIGFPLLQCGISTILFVLCLLFVPTYMGEVFVKTMILVVTLGLIHGLFIVPAFLCAFTAIHETCFSSTKVKNSQVSPGLIYESKLSISPWKPNRSCEPFSRSPHLPNSFPGGFPHQQVTTKSQHRQHQRQHRFLSYSNGFQLP